MGMGTGKRLERVRMGRRGGLARPAPDCARLPPRGLHEGVFQIPGDSKVVACAKMVRLLEGSGLADRPLSPGRCAPPYSQPGSGDSRKGAERADQRHG